MLGKIVLWVTAITFLGYGIACLLSPDLPAGYAGLTMTNGDAFSEIGAMYGGLQIGIGLFCVVGVMNSPYFRPALMLLVLVIGGLATARLYSTLIGVDPVGGYTWGAMAYEFGTAILAVVALRKT